MSGLFNTNSLIPLPPQWNWFYVQRRFETALENMRLTPAQAADGEQKYKGVVGTLNRHYRDIDSETDHCILIGSWGKKTRVRPPRDVDFLYVLPFEVYQQYESRAGNKQSQLLQEIRTVLLQTNPNTNIRGDGQVVVLPFNSYAVEVAPAFLLKNGQYWVCDANDGGRYKTVDPVAEHKGMDDWDKAYNGNVRKLSRLMKLWQRECNVPIKSFHLEAVVKGTLRNVEYGNRDEFWFDWLVRDTFLHLISQANTSFEMHGTAEVIYLGDEWKSRALTAYQRALKACEFERDNKNEEAGEEWQKIFGTMIPRSA